jgi:hypothetical protein
LVNIEVWSHRYREARLPAMGEPSRIMAMGQRDTALEL